MKLWFLSTESEKLVNELGVKSFLRFWTWPNLFRDQENGKEICGPFRVYPGKLSVSRTLGDFGIKKEMNQEIISAIPDISIY